MHFPKGSGIALVERDWYFCTARFGKDFYRANKGWPFSLVDMVSLSSQYIGFCTNAGRDGQRILNQALSKSLWPLIHLLNKVLLNTYCLKVTVIDFHNYYKYLYIALQLLATRSIMKEQQLPWEISFHSSVRKGKSARLCKCISSLSAYICSDPIDHSSYNNSPGQTQQHRRKEIHSFSGRGVGNKYLLNNHLIFCIENWSWVWAWKLL